MSQQCNQTSRQVNCIIAMLIFCFLLYVGGGNINADAAIAFEGAGGKIGLALPEGAIDSTIVFGGIARLGTIIPSLNLEAAVGYWSKSNFSSLTLSATGKYYFPMPGTISPFAGGGLGFVRSSFDIPTVTTIFGNVGGGSTSATDLGLHLVGGVDIAISPKLDLVPEVKLSFGGYDAILITLGAIFNTQ